MPRKKSRPKRKEKDEGSAAFFSGSGGSDVIDLSQPALPKRIQGRKKSAVCSNESVCLSNFSTESSGGYTCRLRHWPVLLPFAETKNLALFATMEDYRICERGKEHNILMESLPASEIEELLYFFRHKQLIIDAVKTGLISIDIDANDQDQQTYIDLSISSETITFS